MNGWYGDNLNCGRCGHLNSRGFCNMTACIYPCETGMGGYINKPQTNADRIRAMTDDELAEFMEDVQTWGGCPNHGARDCTSDCGSCWAVWLKSPVEVDNGT